MYDIRAEGVVNGLRRPIRVSFTIVIARQYPDLSGLWRTTSYYIHYDVSLSCDVCRAVISPLLRSLTWWDAVAFTRLQPQLLSWSVVDCLMLFSERSVWYIHSVQQQVLAYVMDFSVDWIDLLHWVFTCDLICLISRDIFIRAPFTWIPPCRVSLPCRTGGVPGGWGIR